MAGFMDSHKVVVGSAFSAFPSAWNEGESKEGTKSEELKHQFSQVKRDLNLQEMSELVPIPKKSTKEKDNCGILCLCSSIVCIKRIFFFKTTKKKTPEANIIVSPANHTFLILDLQIEPQAFRFTHCILRGKKKNEKRSNSRFNLLQIGHGAFGPWTLV